MIILEEDFETYILFAVFPVYFVLLSIIQSRFLKHLNYLRSKQANIELKKRSLMAIKKLKGYSFLILFVGAMIHAIVYFILCYEQLRNGYFMSVLLFYFIFLIIAWTNFWLKGSSILKDTGGFGGLPG
jgi:hypothetical protein